MKGSFVGMGTVVDLLFCTFPTFLLVKRGLELILVTIPLILYLGGGEISPLESVAACLSPPPHKVCLHYCL